MTKHLEFLDVSVHYGSKQALDEITLSAERNTVLAIVGPANSGKSTLLKTINRTIEFIGSARVTGEVRLAGEDVRRMQNVYALRRRIGMVFPLPVGLPLTVYDNVAYAPRRRGVHNKADLDVIVER